MRSGASHRVLPILVAFVFLSAMAPWSPASASTTRCPAGSLCLWAKPRFQGKRVRISAIGVSSLVALDNKASSLKNNHDRTAFIFAELDGGGEARCFVSGEKVRKLAAVGFNNVASSVKLPSADSTCTDGYPPTVSIDTPQDGEERSSPVVFVGSAVDPQDGTLSGPSIVWTSSIDGEIGTGESFSTPLSAGTHQIVATATDSDGNNGSDEITLLVTP